MLDAIFKPLVCSYDFILWNLFRPQSDTDQENNIAESSSDREKLLVNDNDNESVISTVFNFRNKNPSSVTEKTSAYTVTLFSKQYLFIVQVRLKTSLVTVAFIVILKFLPSTGTIILVT